MSIQPVQILLFRFTKRPSFPSLRFWNSNSKQDLVIFQQRQARQSKRWERLLSMQLVPKFENNTPVSIPSNFKVCEFENWLHGQDKVLSTKKSASANSFLLIS